MTRMTVAVAQTLCCDNVQTNYEKAEKMIGEAAQKGAQLIVFPENMNLLILKSQNAWRFEDLRTVYDMRLLPKKH